MESFRERVANNDGSYFLLMYDGTPIDLSEDDLSEVERSLRIFMENKEVHSDVIKNISFLRTIFVDFDEEYLYIKYHDKTKDEYVEYKNKELTLYDCKYLNTSNKKRETNDSFKSKAEISNRLRNIGPIGIGECEYKIIDTYNLFYNTHPNFFNKETDLVIQCMVLILKKYGINVTNDDFIYNKELEMPISQSLSDRVNGLFPYGIIKSTGKCTAFSEEEKEKIRIIGNQVNSSINLMNRLKELINYTKSLYQDDLNNNDVKQLKKSLN